MESVNNQNIPYVKVNVLDKVTEQSQPSLGISTDTTTDHGSEYTNEEDNDDEVADVNLSIDSKTKEIYQKMMSLISKKEERENEIKASDDLISRVNSVLQITSQNSCSKIEFMKGLHYDKLEKLDLPCSAYVSISYLVSPDLFSVRIL